MKTLKKNKMVEMLLDMARDHAQLAEVDLSYADMASEEISVAVRLASSKKGYTLSDVIGEIYEYTGIMNKGCVEKYILDVSDFKWNYKHKCSIK